MGDPFSYVVTPVIKTAIDLAVSLIRSQINLQQGVKDDIEKLSSNLTTIQAVLVDAEDKQTGSEQLRNWLGKLEEAAYDAEDLLETFDTEAFLWQKKKQARRIPLGTGEPDFKLDAAIKKLLERFDEIGKEKENFDLTVQIETSDDRRTTSYVNEGDIVGREDDKKNILDMLLSEEFDREGHISVVPIIGMGGLGKTTLAQLVYNDDETKSHFKMFMWACVTDKFNYISILKEMIDSHSKINLLESSRLKVMGKNLPSHCTEHSKFMGDCVTHNFKHISIPEEKIESHSKMKVTDIDSSSINLLESLLLELIMGKNLLLVLDDVWTESYHDWEKLERLLKSAGKGSKVLVTSRNTSVFSLNNTSSLYRLGCLPEPECWSLFKNIAFTDTNASGNVHNDLEIIGKGIVHKCEGLPLAVKAMGGLLRGNNDVNKWKRILEHDIWKAEIPTTNLQKPVILPALKLSYNHLPSHIKKCFAYCYIFPKTYLFDKTELIKLWKGASLILSAKRNTTGGIGNSPDSTTDEIGSDYFDVLLRMSFFQVTKLHDVVRYQMHDLIHDLAQSVSIPHCYQVSDKEPCYPSERSRHVSVLCEKAENPVLQVIDKSVKLRTLLAPTGHLKDFGQSLDRLFHTTKFVRALDLSSSTMLELPKSIGELKLLRYLDLCKTEIKRLPDTICSLYHLQTLKLLGCLWLFELPKKLADLVNLQHLELDDMFWNKCCTLPPRMGSMTNLLNLHAFPVSPKNGCGITEMKNMKHLTGTLHISKLEHAVNAREAELTNKERLSEVAFEWSYTDGGSPQDGEVHERVLEDLQPHSNLKKLKISQYRGTSFPAWVRGGLLTNLVTISLFHCTNCKVLSLGQLPHLGELYIKGMLQLEEWEEHYNALVRLKISNCPNLQELPRRFINLRVLKIKKCNSLKALPLTPSLMFLILIDNLVLEEWNEEIVLQSLVTDQPQPQHSFINVIELTIKNCPKMPVLPEPLFALQKLVIGGCPLLTTLPNPNFSKRFQHLALDGCADGTLVNSIPNTDSLSSLVISNISSLSSLPQLPSLPGLKTLYIDQCKDLVSLSEGEVSLLGLKSLTLLSIRDCPKLVTLPEAGLPRALEYLSFESCTSLEVLGPKDILKNLTSLKDLYIENCPSLQSLPEDGIPSSLRHLRIEGCPLLKEECRKDGGPYWPKIMHIPDLEFEYSDDVSSANQRKHSKLKSSVTAFCHGFSCSKGIDISKIEQPQNLKPKKDKAIAGSVMKETKLASARETHSSPNKDTAVAQTGELEFPMCECCGLTKEFEIAVCKHCGMTEECPPSIISLNREKHDGYFICGPCAEVVKGKIRLEGRIGTEEAVTQRTNFGEQEHGDCSSSAK